MAYVNQANYFGFDFQTTPTKKEKGLLFIDDFIFLTVLGKKIAKTLSFILVRIKAKVLFYII